MSIAQMRKLRLQKRRGLAQGRRLSQTARAVQLLLPTGQRRWQLQGLKQELAALSSVLLSTHPLLLLVSLLCPKAAEPKPASGGQALSPRLKVLQAGCPENHETPIQSGVVSRGTAEGTDNALLGSHSGCWVGPSCPSCGGATLQPAPSFWGLYCPCLCRHRPPTPHHLEDGLLPFGISVVH